MLVPYIGFARDGHTGVRKARYSERSWFVEASVLGVYIGICR